ncbi:MAG TPA: PadR family transcriptional regulator [Candidatus Acidoferrum sp.]|nr:PadR family transcriptional regulator [Candidatus Acidoferrum sp.]
MNARRQSDLTRADLVLLSLLAEQPMHGYQANRELERREIRDWAAISRPQVYYCMEKLARLGFLREVQTTAASGGPEKQSFAATEKGLAALAEALKSEEWCTGRDRPLFLTWLALSWQARGRTFARQLRRRQEFLVRELKRERETLASVLDEVGHPYHEAVWMLQLMIEQFEAELAWLAGLRKQWRRRARALHPALEAP